VPVHAANSCLLGGVCCSHKLLVHACSFRGGVRFEVQQFGRYETCEIVVSLATVRVASMHKLVSMLFATTIHICEQAGGLICLFTEVSSCILDGTSHPCMPESNPIVLLEHDVSTDYHAHYRHSMCISFVCKCCDEHSPLQL
jgi:hypothetical protein